VIVDLARIRRVQQLLRERDIDALFVGAGADLRYLTGYHALPLERLTLLVVPAAGDAELVVPELEAPRAKASGAGDLVDVRTFTETDDPFETVAAIVRGAGGDHGTYAVQDRMWTSFTLRLQATLDGRDWLPGSTVMRELRTVKTPDEVAALRRVGRAIDEVHAQVPGLLHEGRTEAEVGRDIAERILAGHDDVNFVIVASGPNGASPHHETGGRVLERGDAVVVDIGGTLDGYCSDMTRNYTVGPAPDGYRELHDVLLAAQRAAVAAVRPGVPAEEVDRAARDVIAAAGHGDHFVHRTGHGIGVEEHEEPWIVAGNDEPLVAGMTFSVEPGIYVPERYGARIEDIVAVTEDGVERLNVLDRELVEVEA
jgi:Xaa-Pro aminopeptidase